jgi:hypothetical protein
MANTVIQLKYSNSTATPSSLTQGEVAYSNNSNKLFVGLSSGAIVAVGGSYYTGVVDAATDANTVSTIVKRDASGIFSATAVRASLYGNANTAAAWQTARLIGVQGDATGQVSVDGSAAANVPLVLANTAVTAGTYGGATQVPTFVVDSKGRITSAANVALSTTFNFAGNTGTGTTSTGGTLTIVGTNGGGITTTFTDSTDTFGVAGTAGNLVTLFSDASGTQFTLSKASGTVSADYLSLQDSAATGGAAWYAGANSTDVSNNTGWTFTAPPSPGAQSVSIGGGITIGGSIQFS